MIKNPNIFELILTKLVIFVNNDTIRKKLKAFFIHISLVIIGLMAFYNAKGDELEENIIKMANELELKYPGSIKVRVAVLQFRTNTNELARFNQYLQDKFFNIYQNSKRFEVIDQVTVNRLLETSNWNLDVSSSFERYNELSEQIFRNLGVVPDAFIYGIIEDQSETISITSYILPNGIKSNNIISVIKFNSSEITDQLLGKQVRGHSFNSNKNPQYFYIYQPALLFSPFFIASINSSRKKENLCFSNLFV